MARRGTVERFLMVCGGLAILGVLAVVLLALGTILGSSDAVEFEPIEEPIEDLLDEPDKDDEPDEVLPGVQPGGSTPESATAFVVRLSGPQGTAYSGTYGTDQGGMIPVEGVLGAEPVEYGIETADSGVDEVSAVFRTSQLVPGIVRAEVLSAGEVVAEGATSEESNWVEVYWYP